MAARVKATKNDLLDQEAGECYNTRNAEQQAAIHNHNAPFDDSALLSDMRFHIL